MHFQRGDLDQEAWANKFLVLLMVPKHVTDIAAEETFSAPAKFLFPVDVGLGHAPSAISSVRRTWPELLDLFRHAIIRGNIGGQTADPRRVRNWLDPQWLVEC